VLTETTEYSSVLGVHGCGGKRAHHLLFTHETIDWQIWIADSTGQRNALVKPLCRCFIV
jgi:hypothetical protein